MERSSNLGSGDNRRGTKRKYPYLENMQHSKGEASSSRVDSNEARLLEWQQCNQGQEARLQLWHYPRFFGSSGSLVGDAHLTHIGEPSVRSGSGNSSGLEHVQLATFIQNDPIGPSGFEKEGTYFKNKMEYDEFVKVARIIFDEELLEPEARQGDYAENPISYEHGLNSQEIGTQGSDHQNDGQRNQGLSPKTFDSTSRDTLQGQSFIEGVQCQEAANLLMVGQRGEDLAQIFFASQQGGRQLLEDTSERGQASAQGHPSTTFDSSKSGSVLQSEGEENFVESRERGGLNEIVPDRTLEQLKPLIDALNDITGDKDKLMPVIYPKIYREFNKHEGKALNPRERSICNECIDSYAIPREKKRHLKNAIQQRYSLRIARKENTDRPDRAQEQLQLLVDALDDVTGKKGMSLHTNHKNIYRKFGRIKGIPLNYREKVNCYAYIDSKAISEDRRSLLKNVIQQRYSFMPRKKSIGRADRTLEQLKPLVDALYNITGDKSKNMYRNYLHIYEEFSRVKGTPLNDREKNECYTYIDKNPAMLAKKTLVKNALKQTYSLIIARKEITDQADRPREQLQQFVDALDDVTGDNEKSLPKNHGNIYEKFSVSKGRPLNYQERDECIKYINSLGIGKEKKKLLKEAVRRYFIK